MREEEPKRRPRIVSSGPSHGDRNLRRVEIGDLTPEEEEKLKGVLAGTLWMGRSEGGELAFHSRFEPLPDPVSDPEMLPFWRTPEADPPVPVQMKLLDLDDFPENQSFAIYIQSLCGYYYTPTRYVEEAEKLIAWGFECMRSRRGNDGRFWEVWYLPGLWAAKGALKEAIGTEEPLREKKTLKRALSFLSRNSSFGTLDVVVQRLAMMVPD